MSKLHYTSSLNYKYLVTVYRFIQDPHKPYFLTSLQGGKLTIFKPHPRFSTTVKDLDLKPNSGGISKSEKDKES